MNLGKLARGLMAAGSATNAPSGLAGEMAQGLSRFPGQVRILVAGADRTGQAFVSGWDKKDSRLAIRAGADHAYSGAPDQTWLVEEILAALSDE